MSLRFSGSQDSFAITGKCLDIGVMRTFPLLLASVFLISATQDKATQAISAEQYEQDARLVQQLIGEHYAYLDRFAGNAVPTSPRLQAEAAAVSDRRSLLRYAERALLALTDHHAITGSSLRDSWAVVPSYTDLWIVEHQGRYLVNAVRADSAAAQAGIMEGAELLAIEGQPAAEAVAGFWLDLGLEQRDREARAFAARVLVAGRRDRSRNLTIRTAKGKRTIVLPSLYEKAQADRPPLTYTVNARCFTIHFNDSLGDDATIAAFDAAMLKAAPRQPICLDLTDTPSGGNTVVARTIMGWFVTRASSYQMHSLPAEERRTGIARQWVEQVLPRVGKHHAGPVSVRVGRWTGSMGEGLAIGLQAIGANLTGGDMAGLRGAIYDFRLPASGLVVKLPAERLYTVAGIPREEVVISPTPQD